MTSAVWREVQLYANVQKQPITLVWILSPSCPHKKNSYTNMMLVKKLLFWWLFKWRCRIPVIVIITTLCIVGYKWSLWLIPSAKSAELLTFGKSADCLLISQRDCWILMNFEGVWVKSLWVCKEEHWRYTMQKYFKQKEGKAAHCCQRLNNLTSRKKNNAWKHIGPKMNNLHQYFGNVRK